MSFEKSLAALEKIVRDLETGDLPLEESLKLFETGVKLSRECQERLSQAERRIEVLQRDENGEPRIEPLTGGDDDNKKPVEPKIKRRIVFDSDDENSVF